MSYKCVCVGERKRGKTGATMNCNRLLHIRSICCTPLQRRQDTLLYLLRDRSHTCACMHTDMCAYGLCMCVQRSFSTHQKVPAGPGTFVNGHQRLICVEVHSIGTVWHTPHHGGLLRTCTIAKQ
jgi:hypothetical protein